MPQNINTQNNLLKPETKPKKLLKPQISKPLKITNCMVVQ